MPVGMPYMHLAHTPRVIGRRRGDIEAFGKAALVFRIDIVYPDGHPYALI
jgi:hypothetical protein